ncbi:unnamed protein product, partial [Rotaria magnacalcarata]
PIFNSKSNVEIRHRNRNSQFEIAIEVKNKFKIAGMYNLHSRILILSF